KDLSETRQPRKPVPWSELRGRQRRAALVVEAYIVATPPNCQRPFPTFANFLRHKTKHSTTTHKDPAEGRRELPNFFSKVRQVIQSKREVAKSHVSNHGKQRAAVGNRALATMIQHRFTPNQSRLASASPQ
ncbi:hypothetical protein, partial [Aminobacter carboxidus]|uniref:hypothetical protein n=1 Tax=Aminobacter carboxidus TaxID=376165 RepID=UPI001AEE4E53